MIANGWTYEQIEMAMIRTSVRYKDNIQFVQKPTPTNIKGTRWKNLRIKPVVSSRRKDGSYPAGSLVNPTMAGGRRSCGAACWHAYGYFIRTLFDINPIGRIGTREAMYLGMDGFNQVFRETGYRMRGGRIDGMEYHYCCDCHEHELTEF
jgi:hypothetical protein